MPTLQELEIHFCPDFITGGRVVLFRNVQSGGPLRLVRQLAKEYRPYAACDADELVRVDQLADGDFSFLESGHAKGCMVEFDSDRAIIRRLRFRFYGSDNPFDAKLDFTTANLPDPLPIAAVVAEIARFAGLLDAGSYTVHHETNTQWQIGDFSDATLIYAGSDFG